MDLEKAFVRVPREVISRAMRKLGVEEWLVSTVMSMLHAGDLAVIAETEEEIIKRLNECQWKDNVESKGTRDNINKTKVTASGESQKVRQKAARWPCGVCSKGVGSKSLQCTSCQKWVHKKCSCTKGRLSKVMKSSRAAR